MPASLLELICLTGCSETVKVLAHLGNEYLKPVLEFPVATEVLLSLYRLNDVSRLNSTHSALKHERLDHHCRCSLNNLFSRLNGFEIEKCWCDKAQCEIAL